MNSKLYSKWSRGTKTTENAASNYGLNQNLVTKIKYSLWKKGVNGAHFCLFPFSPFSL